MKEVCSWGQALRFYAISGVCLSFCFVKVIDQDVIRTCLTVHMSPLHQDPVKKKFLFCFAFFVVCLDLVFYFDLICFIGFCLFVLLFFPGVIYLGKQRRLILKNSNIQCKKDYK